MLWVRSQPRCEAKVIRATAKSLILFQTVEIARKKVFLRGIDVTTPRPTSTEINKISTNRTSHFRILN